MSTNVLCPEDEWLRILSPYPPMLSPRQCEKISNGLLSASQIYRRSANDRPSLDLEVRRVNNKPRITKKSLYEFLCGVVEKAL